MKKIFLLAAFVLLVSACSTYKPPVEETIQKTITIDRQSSQVFDDVVAFFAEKGTPLKQIDKQSGIVTTESNLKANNDYANCGSGKFRVREMKTTMNVVVRSAAEGKTTVTINTFWKGLVDDSWFVFYQDCFSNGVFEKALFDYLQSSARK